jgi:membrane-associated phospholipid phosphatase
VAAADRLVLEHRRLLVALALLLGGVAAVCWMLAKTTDLFPSPYTPVEPVLTLNSTGWRIARQFDSVADPGMGIPIVLAVAVFAIRTGVPRLAWLAIASALVVFVTDWAKGVGPLTTLPSGHAAFSASVLGYATWLSARSGERAAAAVLGAIAVAVAPSLVLEGAHHAVDVLAGFALGLAWALGVLALAGPWALAVRSRG